MCSAMANPLNTPLHMSYHAELSNFVSKGVCITRGTTPSQKMGALAYHAKFDRRLVKGTSVEIRRKNGPLMFHLSRSLKVTRTDTDRSATYDFPLTFCINRGPILYRFQDIARYWPKIAHFSEPTFTKRPHIPLELGIIRWIQEIRMTGLPGRGKV